MLRIYRLIGVASNKCSMTFFFVGLNDSNCLSGLFQRSSECKHAHYADCRFPARTALGGVNVLPLTMNLQNLILRMGPSLGFFLICLGLPRSTKSFCLSDAKACSLNRFLFAIRVSSARMASYSLSLFARLGLFGGCVCGWMSKSGGLS